MTKREKLQMLVDGLWEDDDDDRPFVEFRPFKVWFMVFPESRWLGDEGEYLGDYQQARKTIRFLLK